MFKTNYNMRTKITAAADGLRTDEADANLADSMWLPLKIGHLAGLLPFERSSNAFRVSTWGVVMAILCLLAYIIGHYILFEAAAWSDIYNTMQRTKDDNLTNIIYCTLCLTNVVVTFLEMVSVLLSGKKIKTTLDLFLALRVSTAKAKAIELKLRKDCLTFGGVSALLLAFFIIPFIFTANYIYLLGAIMFIYHGVVDIIICGFVKSLRYFLENINESISMKLKERILEGLGDLQAEHGTACVLIDDANKCFEWDYIARVAQAFVLSVATLVYMFNFGLNNVDVFGGVAMMLLALLPTLLIAFVRLYIACLFATTSEDEVNTSARLLATHCKSSYSWEQRLEVIGFQQQIEFMKPKISARGYFEVSKGLILEVLGHVGTYVVVFLQFQPPAPPTVQCCCTAGKMADANTTTPFYSPTTIPG